MNFNLDNMYCGAIRRGDIILVGSGKDEAAMVALQDYALNETLHTILCAPIKPHRKDTHVYVTDVVLPAEETGLGKDGVVILYHIAPVDRRAIIAKKGELPPEKLHELFHALDVSLGRFRDKK